MQNNDLYNINKKKCYLSVNFKLSGSHKKMDVNLSRATFSSIYFSCLTAPTSPDVYLSWAKFSSSLMPQLSES